MNAQPVRRALRRMLLGVGLCVALLLALYLVLEALVGELQGRQARLHTPAVAMGTELEATLAGIAAPPGVAPSFVERLDDPTLFMASVTRDVARARALLDALLELHRRAADPAFAALSRRLERARAELVAIEQQHGRDPLELARALATRPLYASIVAEQVARSHRAAGRALEAQRLRLQRWFGALFVGASLLLLAGFGWQVRRSLQGVDAVLEQERRTLEALRASRAALQEAQVLARLGNWELDLRQGGVWWSEEMYRLFELDPAPAAPPLAQWLERIDAADRERFAAALAAPSDAALAALGTVLVPRRDGSPRHLAWRARADRDDHGRPQRLIGTAQDVTERRLAEQALARSRDELERLVDERTLQLTAARDSAEQANRAKSEFLSRMSHELRTPMNAVLGFTQLLGLESGLAPKSREYVDHVLRAGKHLLHLINDVLDLAQVESGRMTLSPEPIAIDTMLDEVVALMQPLAVQHRVALEIEAPVAAVLRGDRLRVKQVLLNLLSNAIKYNRPGGWVRLGVAAADGERVRLRVADSGQGISADGLAGLFEPFNRLGAESGPVEGTGIGLSICKRLVELMGGRIGADSRAGVGSEFWIELPRDRLAPPPSTGVATEHGAGAGAAAPRGPACVLYVEDNPANLLLVQQIVARHRDIRLISAPSARLGFELARVHRPNLILLDIHLPDATGYALLERLRADELTRAIPAVAVTANAMPGESARALLAGFADYMAKPLDVGRFDALLNRMLADVPPAAS